MNTVSIANLLTKLEALAATEDAGKTVLDGGVVDICATLQVEASGDADALREILPELRMIGECRALLETRGWRWVPCTSEATDGAAEPGPGIANPDHESAYPTWVACALEQLNLMDL